MAFEFWAFATTLCAHEWGKQGLGYKIQKRLNGHMSTTCIQSSGDFCGPYYLYSISIIYEKSKLLLIFSKGCQS